MKKNKLSKEELQKLNEIQDTYNKLVLTLGQLEVQKTSLWKKIEEVQYYQETFGKELHKKYGDGNINPETGEFTKSE